MLFLWDAICLYQFILVSVESVRVLKLLEMPRGNCTKREERDKERRKEAIACTHEERKVALWEVALARYNQQSNPNLPKEKAERRLLKQALGNDAATWHSQVSHTN